MMFQIQIQAEMKRLLRLFAMEFEPQRLFSGSAEHNVGQMDLSSINDDSTLKG